MSTTDHYRALVAIVQTFLAQEQGATPEFIRQLIERYRGLHAISDADAEGLARYFESIYEIQMDVGAVLKDEDFEPWLDAAQPDIDPYYWDRYKRLLATKGFNGQVLASLEEVTDRTLGLLENPKKGGPWDRRGMVVGHVQSGKTSNYTGLVCKAADAGYKLIVIIAGVHNNLRSQTQARIDEGFVGRDSSPGKPSGGNSVIGVGKFANIRRPVTFTNTRQDFAKNLAQGVGVSIRTLNEPAVFVIKKNPNTLNNLIGWLEENNSKAGTDKVAAPMLLIDDEADNASINIQFGKGGVARINGQIRKLLNLFERSSYVGYTATPFANIFIDPDTDDDMFKADLFPENFIVSLDPPSNYLGPTKMFLDEPRRFIRTIDDNEDVLPLKHKIDLIPTELPESLRYAIRSFVLVRAVRLARGDTNSHNSMLINASRFTGVQERLRNEVHSYLGMLQDAIRVHGKREFETARADSFIASLFATWESEFSDVAESWELVYSHLSASAAPVKAITVNSKAAGTLNYAEHDKTGLNVIAIGGYSLSRGLTLEGLSVSYFLRNSTMYDTLMQMGRWFGYRPNYEDLCRVWMPEEAEGWYAHIAEAVDELRTELRDMERVGATPREFGLKVRSHPDTLIVTARNRMGEGHLIPVRIGLSNKFVETSTLRRNEEALQSNRLQVQALVKKLGQAGYPIDSAEDLSSGLLLRSVPAGPITDFVAAFTNDPRSLLTAPGPIVVYIRERDFSELAEWDVFFPSVSQELKRGRSELIGRTIVRQERASGDKSDAQSIRVTNKQRVASRGVERVGLTEEQVLAAEEAFIASAEGLAQVKNGSSVNYPDRIYRAKRDRPLLIVHLLDIIEPKRDSGPQFSNVEDVVAWGISFPTTALPEDRVEYMVNGVWLKEQLAGEEDTDEDMESTDV